MEERVRREVVVRVEDGLEWLGRGHKLATRTEKKEPREKNIGKKSREAAGEADPDPPRAEQKRFKKD